MDKQPRVLVVDDIEANVRLLSGLISREKKYIVDTAQGAAGALEMMERNKPDIILLDIMMPDINGFQLAEIIKKDPRHASTPIIFITALSDQDSIAKAFDFGGVDYIVKPFNPAEVLKRIATHLRLKLLMDNLEDEVEARTKEVRAMNRAFVVALENASRFNDEDTGAHVVRLCHYSRLLAKEMGLPEEKVNLIYRYASLHDIGKIGIPSSILQKPGKLTPEEFDVMKRHSRMGYEIINLPGIPDEAKNIPLHHHEKYDGTGYPDGLKGEAIPVEARIVALADVYDALRSKRCYKDPFTHEQADQIINDLEGTHFDPKVVEAYRRHADEFRRIFDTIISFDQ